MTQPIEAAAVPGALLQIETISAVTGISIPTIRRWWKQGTFPQGVLLSPKCRRWTSEEVMQWREQRLAASRGSPPTAASSAGAGP
jgi:prophage regulatory protein